MSENRADASPPRLVQAVRQVRNDLADRDDVVVEMREAQRVRLELLAAELADVIADVPEDQPIFDFAISSGAQPRFWIDPVAHVAMARDKRSYRFVRDSRAGRVVIAESPNMRLVADAVTRYVAERIVERQRHLEAPAPVPRRFLETFQWPSFERPSKETLISLALFGTGLLSGVVLVLSILRDRVPELNLF